MVIAVLAMLSGVARAAIPLTNSIIIAWSSPSNSVPYLFDVHQSNLETNAWESIAVLPSTVTNLTVSVDSALKFWRVRSINATNFAWNGEFSNVASSADGVVTVTLSVRLGL